jgi:hypothetical protein
MHSQQNAKPHTANTLLFPYLFACTFATKWENIVQEAAPLINEVVPSIS